MFIQAVLRRFGDEPFVALLETSTLGSPGGGKESVYRLYLVIKELLCDNLSDSFFRVMIPKLPNASYKERRRKQGWDWNIVLS